MNSCFVCKKTGKVKKCSTCKQVVYCSKVCQIKHWKVHKKECGTFDFKNVATYQTKVLRVGTLMNNNIFIMAYHTLNWNHEPNILIMKNNVAALVYKLTNYKLGFKDKEQNICIKFPCLIAEIWHNKKLINIIRSHPGRIMQPRIYKNPHYLNLLKHQRLQTSLSYGNDINFKDGECTLGLYIGGFTNTKKEVKYDIILKTCREPSYVFSKKKEVNILFSNIEKEETILKFQIFKQ